MTHPMPRIAPVEEPDDEQAETLAKTLLDGGAPLRIFATLAHHPRLLKRFNVLGGFFLAHGRLPPRERELAILRVAWRTDSVYEFGQHVAIGDRAGLIEGEIWQVTQEELPGPWAPSDATLLAVVDQVLESCDVDDVAWDAMANWMDTAQLLELVCLVGFYRMVAGLLRTVRIEPEDELAGWPENP